MNAVVENLVVLVDYAVAAVLVNEYAFERIAVFVIYLFVYIERESALAHNVLLNVDTVADTAGSCVGTFGKAGDFVLCCRQC